MRKDTERHTEETLRDTEETLRDVPRREYPILNAPVLLPFLLPFRRTPPRTVPTALAAHGRAVREILEALLRGLRLPRARLAADDDGLIHLISNNT